MVLHFAVIELNRVEMLHIDQAEGFKLHPLELIIVVFHIIENVLGLIKTHTGCDVSTIDHISDLESRHGEDHDLPLHVVVDKDQVTVLKQDHIILF